MEVVDTGKRFGFVRSSANASDFLRRLAAPLLRKSVRESVELNLQDFLGIGRRAAMQDSFKSRPNHPPRSCEM
jgi:hypothetical protein